MSAASSLRRPLKSEGCLPVTKKNRLTYKFIDIVN